MTSDLSNEVASLKPDDESTASTARRCYRTGHHQRHHLHTKRSATLDPETNEEKLRIVVLGATKVGKTCLCQQFLQDKFLNDHKETVDEMHSVELSLVGRRITLEILDTAGIDEFPVMRRIAIAHGDAFLILYAINDRHSFDIARQLHELVREIKGNLTSIIPIVIVGNKCDLDPDRREIGRDFAETIVHDHWKATLVEATCQQRDSVLNAFRTLLHLANINTTLSPDVTRRSSDPILPSNRGQHSSNKRQSCAQQ